MARHFLGLYLLIVLTLAAVSWGQDKLLQAYGARDVSDERMLAGALSAVESRLQSAPASEWKHLVDGISAEAGVRFRIVCCDRYCRSRNAGQARARQNCLHAGGG